MKQILLKPYIFWLLITFQWSLAQENIPFLITSGFNADVIANGSGSALNSTSTGLDLVNYCLMTTDFQPTSAAPPAFALPLTGQITNNTNPTIGFQMGDYASNNTLKLVSVNNTGTLNFGNPMTASKLYVLVNSGNGASTVTATVQFNDNTTQIITGNVVPDWFNSTALPVVTSGIGRVNRTTNAIENPAGNPRLYQLTLNILPENQSKVISGVQFTKTSTAEGAFNAFAVTAETLPSCPQPINMSATTTANSASVSWNASAVIPNDGYDYFFSTTNTAPVASTIPTGNVVSTQNFVNFIELSTGVTYYVWVRSRCDADTQSNWSFISFTTGQIQVINTNGDLPTLYNNTVNINSTTSCPATLSVTIPEGYQIASIATAYQMTAAGGAWQSEQRSRLFCTTTNSGETVLFSGPPVNGGGVASYNRSDLSFANGATGTVNFELRTWRTWGDSGCGTNFNKVNSGTWSVTVTYELIPCVAPTAPQAENQSFCGNALLSDLMVNGLEGASIQWYQTANSDIALDTNVALSTNQYFVSQSINDCESERTMIEVTVFETPTIPTAESQTLCQNSMIIDLIANGAEGAIFNWYESEDSETALLNNEILQSGSYFVSQTINNCESEKLEVIITILETPDVVDALDQVFCNSAVVADLEVINNTNQINWYASIEATEPLPLDFALVSGIYYVSQNINSCEGPRSEVLVEITEVPEAPTYSGTLIFNQGTMLFEIDINFFANMIIQWYIMNEDGSFTPIESNTIMEETTYYVSQSLNGCESEFLAIEVETILSSLDFEISNLAVFPNPTVNDLFIRSNKAIDNVLVYNLMGQKIIYVENLVENKLNVTHLQSGTYLLTINFEDMESKTMRFVKK